MNHNLTWDKEHIWHPYSSLKSPNSTFYIQSANGVNLQLDNGLKLIDGMSSWWAAIHGYNHPVLNQALIEQSKNMSHVMFGGLTHQPAIDLSKKLIELTDPSLDFVFFSDSGSVAVEVALKMALQYWIAQGIHGKNKFISFNRGYHGDTFAAMSVCDPVTGMHQLFSGFLHQNYFAQAPTCFSKDLNKYKTIDLSSVEKLLMNNNDIAAIIIEPIVQGAGGMRIYCPEYLAALNNLAEKYQVLLIFDEIATGFGRTGTLFAYEQANIAPDILCLGKALTGGYLSLAATLCNQKVVDGIHYDNQGVLMHGPTFMANPLACSIANASIDLLLSTPWQEKILKIEHQLKQQLAECIDFQHVSDVRVKGAIAVIELDQNVDTNALCEDFVEQGVWIRPFAKLIYLMPPFIIEPEQLSQLTQAIKFVLTKYY
ncbi:MAG: adenosylmethionine--8-amino-7-oxononanoate transaminase [Gammaproteobacteria bacterium]|nr:adenosylmethionine--8-amino-7-oxononanoate transaminase [Gammaproteobacteria bacterium]